MRATVHFKAIGKERWTHATVRLMAPPDSTDVLWRRALAEFRKIGFYRVFQMADEYKNMWRALAKGTTLDGDMFKLSDVGCNEAACRIPGLNTPVSKKANKLLKHMTR